MRFETTCLLTIMSTVKTVSAFRSVSIFEAVPFEAYFDVIQCCLLFLLTIVILILTAIHFCQTRPPELTLSRPSSFEYYVLKGESISRNGYSKSTATDTGTTRRSTEGTGTTGTGTTGTGTGTGTGTNSGLSYFAM